MDRTSHHLTPPQDLRQFAALQAVAATGSITQAGKRLGWSDATINYHLAALEKLLGAALLHRTKRGSTLTPLAQQLLPHAVAALNLAAHAVQQAQTAALGGDTLLRFGAFPTAASQLLPRITRQLRKTSCRLQAHLHEVSTLNQLVANHSLDAALSYTVPQKPFSDSSFHITTVLTEAVLLALPATHRMAQRSSVSVSELLQIAAENWIMGASSGDPLDDTVQQIFAAAGKSLNITVSTDDYSVALGLVSAGLAVALVPQLACLNPPAGIRLIPVADTRLQRSIVLLTPRLTHLPELPQQPGLQLLITAVRKAAAELSQLPLARLET